MSTTNFPTHPIFSWKPTITGSVTYDDGTDSGSINLATLLSDDFWGWSSDASNIAQADSIQGKLAAEIVSLVTAASALVVTYTWPDGDAAPPISSWALTHSGSQNVALVFSSAATAYQFGFAAASVTLTYVAPLAAGFTDAGHWQPSCRGGNSDERWSINPNIGITETINGSAIKQRSWGSSLDSRPFTFPAVLSANIQSASAAEATFAAAAQRNILDPNSMLQTMLEAARTPENTDDAREFRVFSSAGVYRSCYFVDTGQITEVEKLCSSASVRRVWSVSFVMRDRG